MNSGSTNESSLSMKDKALAALNKCAINSVSGSSQHNQDLQKALLLSSTTFH